jgi:hypothetical protein
VNRTLIFWPATYDDPDGEPSKGTQSQPVQAVSHYLFPLFLFGLPDGESLTHFILPPVYFLLRMGQNGIGQIDFPPRYPIPGMSYPKSTLIPREKFSSEEQEVS